jgi:hypothetical protein
MSPTVGLGWGEAVSFSQIGKRYGTRMNMKRMRGRNHRGGNGGGGGGSGGGGGGGGPQIRAQGGNVPLNRNHVFDSTGPDLRIRGTAQQLFEKYLQLGRDASSSGDRVMAESYFQYAEHYFRILNAMNQAAQQGQPAGTQRPQRTHESNGPEAIGGSQQEGEGEEPESVGQATIIQPAGMGDQPGGDSREIPISAAPPEE